MGPWYARHHSPVRWPHRNDELLDVLDVFEEQGVVKTPFNGGFGLLADAAFLSPLQRLRASSRLGEHTPEPAR